MNKAVFLDRDGVLNQTVFRLGKPRAPYTLDEFSLCPGVEAAIQILKNKGYVLIVVTNQPDVARGWVTREAVNRVNDKLKELLPVNDIKACFHTDKDDCFCRKPKPGMLLDAIKDWNINPEYSFMVGDRYSDVEAGLHAGCKTILIGEGDGSSHVVPHFRKGNLLEAALLIDKLS